MNTQTVRIQEILENIEGKRVRELFLVTKCLDPKKAILGGELTKIICDTLCHYADKEEIFIGSLCRHA